MRLGEGFECFFSRAGESGGLNCHPMQVFLFQSLTDAGIVAFTSRCDGTNLPMEFSPWESRGRSTLRIGVDIASVENRADAVLNGIRKSGYFLARWGRFMAP